MTTDPTPQDGSSAPDPSMDDILASIRRILDEEGQKPEDAPKPPAVDDGVLALDDFAVGAEETPIAARPSLPSPPSLPSLPPMRAEPAPVPGPGAEVMEEPDPFDSAPSVMPVSVSAPAYEEPPPLVAPAAAAAAAVSVGALLRTLASERSTAVHRGGPTIEDLVREEMRPLLKEWLDVHLPPLVERLVRAEIERVVSRMT